MCTARPNEWVRVEDAAKYGRGGLLPMAVFLTKNAPGLRTSPVKRGYWVVQRVLGEADSAAARGRSRTAARRGEDGSAAARHAGPASRRIRAAPPATPASIRSAWSSKATARSANARQGSRRPRRSTPAPPSPAAAKATASRASAQYIREHRQNDFVDNLCRKLLAYALGRSLMLSDELTIEEMRAQARGRRISLRDLDREHRHQPAVPEQAHGREQRAHQKGE